MILRSTVLSLVLLFSIASAQAGVRLSAAGNSKQSTRKVNGSGASSVIQDEKESEISGDILAGYVFPFSLYVGGIIHQTRDSRVLTTTSQIDSVRSAYGISSGLVMGGWLAIAHYYFKAEEKPSLAASASSLTGGNGFQLDFGYGFSILSHLRIGPQVSYRQFRFGDYTVGSGAVQAVSGKQIELRPQLMLAIEF